MSITSPNKLQSLLISLSRKLTGWPPRPASTAERHAIIRGFAAERPGAEFVETGTFEGDTIAAMEKDFAQLHSIELSGELYARAQQRFAGKPKIHLYQGDSAERLGEVVASIPGPIVYWLDGHYSGGSTARGSAECPIMGELRAIARRANATDAVLIDDARHFGWRPGYPSLKILRAFVQENLPGFALEVRSDIICIFRAQ